MGLIGTLNGQDGESYEYCTGICEEFPNEYY